MGRVMAAQEVQANHWQAFRADDLLTLGHYTHGMAQVAIEPTPHHLSNMSTSRQRWKTCRIAPNESGDNVKSQEPWPSCRHVLVHLCAGVQ